MKGSSAYTVQIICDECGKLFAIEGSHIRTTLTQRIKFARCPHCGYSRTTVPLEPGTFQCVGPCGVTYKIRKHWRPVRGMCMTCYMRAYRAAKRLTRLSKSV